MKFQPAIAAAVTVGALVTRMPATVHADESVQTTPATLSATQIAERAPVIGADPADTHFHLDIRGSCGTQAAARLGVMIADTAVAENHESDPIELPEFSIAVPAEQLSGLQPGTLCPRLLRSNKRGDALGRFAVPAAFTAFVSLRCTAPDNRVRTAYRAVALDALIDCSESPPADDAEPG